MAKKLLNVVTKSAADVVKEIEADQPPKVLPPHPELARGPVGLKPSSDALPEPEYLDTSETDYGILNMVHGRLYRTTPFAEPILALEVLAGPYKGVVYSYASFTFLPGVMSDGMVPTKYETTVHIVPKGLTDAFVKDEAFDVFTSEVLIAWIGYIHTHDYTSLLKVHTRGTH